MWNRSHAYTQNYMWFTCLGEVFMKLIISDMFNVYKYKNVNEKFTIFLEINICSKLLYIYRALGFVYIYIYTPTHRVPCKLVWILIYK